MHIEDFPESSQYKSFLDDIKGYYGSEAEADEHKSISERIEELRKSKGVSLQKLSDISGLPIDLLSRIEKREVLPNLGTVIKLSRALKTASSMLIGEQSGYHYSLVRFSDRQKIRRHISGTSEKTDYEYQSLASGVENRTMESFIVTFGTEKQVNAFSSHAGEEFILMLKGSVKVVLGKKEEILEKGDTIYFPSSIPHSIIPVPGEVKAEILAVISTGKT